MKRFSNHWVIHSFALLHAATTILCYALGIGDTLFLTLWTVIMTILLCVREHLSAELTVFVVILGNIVGYLIGVAIAGPIGAWIPQPVYAHALSTFLTTEGLGWAILGFVRLFPGLVRHQAPVISYNQLKWITIVAVVILALRIALNIVLQSRIFAEVSIVEMTSDFLADSVLLLLMAGTTLLYLLYSRRNPAWMRRWHTHILAFLLISLAAALVAALLGGLNSSEGFSWNRLFQLLVVASICEAVVFSVVYLAVYALTVHRRMEAERGRANLAQHEYRQLKQQVNPHFLFNSLNILDCLIADGENSQARDYVHKLSSLYRYMLRSENEPVVQLSEEMEYVQMYLDLLKVRFPTGLEVETDLPDAALSRYIIKYSVQMLVENAQKHNAISADKPLHLRIASDGTTFTVANSRNPKLSPPDSTGVGLKYIRQNYLDRCGKDIRIQETDDQYLVELPFL
ncbi:MAG: histidine kinase [Bacteroidales bacterium]|nr:histidine kinase [Bacteroidales bacterium]